MQKSPGTRFYSVFPGTNNIYIFYFSTTINKVNVEMLKMLNVGKTMQNKTLVIQADFRDDRPKSAKTDIE